MTSQSSSEWLLPYLSWFFFLVYTASAFSAGAKLFSSVFGLDYIWALAIGAAVILIYTFFGGFLAVCWTDFIQGFMMLIALMVVPFFAVSVMGGFGETKAVSRQLGHQLFKSFL